MNVVFFFFLKYFFAVPVLIWPVSTQSDPVVSQIPRFSSMQLEIVRNATGKYGRHKMESWKCQRGVCLWVTVGIIFTCAHSYSTNSLKVGSALCLYIQWTNIALSQRCLVTSRRLCWYILCWSHNTNYKSLYWFQLFCSVHLQWSKGNNWSIYLVFLYTVLLMLYLEGTSTHLSIIIFI